MPCSHTAKGYFIHRSLLREESIDLVPASMEAKLKTTSIVLLIMTTIWVVLTVISMSGTDPLWSDGEYLLWVADPDIYLNCA